MSPRTGVWEGSVEYWVVRAGSVDGSGWVVVAEPGEFASMGWTAGIEDHSHHVDGYVVVIPAETYEVVRVVVSTQ